MTDEYLKKLAEYNQQYVKEPSPCASCARIIGASGSTEARLLARISDLESELTKVKQDMNLAVSNAGKELIAERDSLRLQLAGARESLERIEGMAERPICICGSPTGTAALRACARAALDVADKKEVK